MVYNKGTKTLNKLSKKQLIELLLESQSKRVPKPKKLAKSKPIPKGIPKPKKSVKQMVKGYENNIILPPPEFRDDYKPPVSTPKIEITPLKQALKNSVESYEVSIKNKKDPLAQLNNTALTSKNFMNRILKEQKGLK